MEYLFELSVGPQKVRAAVMVARLQPPTIGHYKVIDAMKAYIRENPNLNLHVPVVVIVDGEKTSKDKVKNPLTAEERVKFIQASGRANGVQILIAKSGFAAFEETRKNGYEPIAIAAGSDRAEKYLDLLDKYFVNADGEQMKHVKVDGLDREGADNGERKNNLTAMQKALDELKKGGILDVAEVSGSMARRAVEMGYAEEFAQIVGLENKPRLAQLMFNKIKSSLEEAEE